MSDATVVFDDVMLGNPISGPARPAGRQGVRSPVGMPLDVGHQVLVYSTLGPRLTVSLDDVGKTRDRLPGPATVPEYSPHKQAYVTHDVTTALSIILTRRNPATAGSVRGPIRQFPSTTNCGCVRHNDAGHNDNRILPAPAPHPRRDCAGFGKSGAQSRTDKRLDLQRWRRTAI